MGRYVIEQPNGKYAIWSTTTESFEYLNQTRDQVLRHYCKSDMEKLEEERPWLLKLRRDNPDSQDRQDYERQAELRQELIDISAKHIFDPARMGREDFDTKIGWYAFHSSPEDANAVLREIGEPPRDFTEVIAEYRKEHEMDEETS